MQNYKPGTIVPVMIPLVDEAGVVLTPTSSRWRVIDEAEVQIGDWTNTASTDDSLTVEVPALATTLVPPAVRGIRTVEVEVTTADGVLTISQSFMLQGPTALVFGVNTFQTYTQALLAAEDYVDMPGWAGVGRESREKALIQAFTRIMLLPIGVHMDDTQSYMLEGTHIYGPLMLRFMTPANMANLYSPMLSDLRKAQLAEAEYVLSADPVSLARDNGLISMTVGESSQFFRSGKPLNLPLSSKALAFLERWIRIRATLGRA